MLKWRLYGLVRPVVRPVMRRLRLFFVGRLHDELAELRHEVAELRTLLERRARSDDDRVRDALAEALATLSLDRDAPPR